jgi:hypothetical protein
MIYTMFVFLGIKWLGHGTAQHTPDILAHRLKKRPRRPCKSMEN